MLVAMRTVFSLMFVLALSACASARTFDGEMRDRYVGKPVADAIRDFGPAKGSYATADGGTAYTWQKRQSESIFGPAVTQGSGYQILGKLPDGHGVYWQGVTQYRCVIRAATQGGTVTGLRFEGNPGGCETILGYKRAPLGKSAY